MKNLFALPVLILALAGCGDNTLDWRNAKISGGKVYSGDENKPFTGILTNAPEEKLPMLPVWRGFRDAFNKQASRYDMQAESISYQGHVCDTNLDNGVVVGDVECRDHKGVKRWEATFPADGTFIVFATDGTTKLADMQYKDGQSDGTSTLFNLAGSKIGEFHNLEGKGEGVQQLWYPNGQLKYRQSMEEGFTVGVVEEWHSNGQKAADTPYQNRKIHGTFQQWDEQGNLIKTVDFIDGYPAPTPVAQPATSCIDLWINAYRKEMGEDAGIRSDILEEWEGMCEAGQTPG